MNVKVKNLKLHKLEIKSNTVELQEYNRVLVWNPERYHNQRNRKKSMFNTLAHLPYYNKSNFAHLCASLKGILFYSGGKRPHLRKM